MLKPLLLVRVCCSFGFSGHTACLPSNVESITRLLQSGNDLSHSAFRGRRIWPSQMHNHNRPRFRAGYDSVDDYSGIGLEGITGDQPRISDLQPEFPCNELIKQAIAKAGVAQISAAW